MEYVFDRLYGDDATRRFLLADEVGLGKTVQTLMILNALRLQNPRHRALILVPDPFFNEPGYERVRNTPEGDVQKQADLLFAAQRHFHGLDFPKDDAGKALVQQAFKSLFLTEVVDIDAFEAWRDDESEEREAIPGKIKTLTQTTDFFSYLDTVDDDDDEEEDEDEDEDEEEEEA